MIRVFVPSASYILSDYLLSSEGTSCYALFQSLERFGYFFEAVSPYIRVKVPLSNVEFHQVGSFQVSPTAKPILKYFSHSEFLIRSYQKTLDILRVKEIDVIHHMLPAVYSQTFSPIALLGRMRKPFVFGPLSAHFYPRPSDERMLLGLTSRLHRKTIEKCDALITITDQVKRLYSAFFDEERIWTIPLGVDTETFKPSKNHVERECHEILFAGYLYKLKGVEYLMRAMQMIAEERKDVKLRIIGDGPNKHNLQKLAEALNLKTSVIFEGVVSHTRMPKYYQQSDVVCFPTLGEPFGKVIIEAMACAKPVVASNIGGSAEIIQDRKNGILVAPGRPDLLAREILSLLEDETAGKTIGASARETVVEKYSWEKIAEDYHRLYSSLV
jgi:glycosyltransferase involved in cell wall biosynthesis